MKLYLYGLMLGMPLLGWIYLSADGAAINVWAFPLPAIAPESKAWRSWPERHMSYWESQDIFSLRCMRWLRFTTTTWFATTPWFGCCPVLW